MPLLKHFEPADSRAAILESVRADGACVIDSVLTSEFVAELRGETDPYMDATANGSDGFVGRLTTRTGGLVMRSSKARELIQHELILALCDGFLLEYCERYQLHLGQIIRIRSGQRAQPIHRDRWAWGTHLAHVEPQLNTIWALTDFTADNGATQVVPGSVGWDDSRLPEPGEIARAEMAKGSVLIYTGSVFHGGGKNSSGADRIGLNITYSLGWLRQEENQYLSTPPHLARELEPDLQRLVGYSMGQYALGYFTPPGPPGEAPEVVDPQAALAPGSYTAQSLGGSELREDLVDQIQSKRDG